MKKFKNYAKGFTLIELLVVIAIIGILSSVVLVSLNTARNKGKSARIQTNAAQIKTGLEANYDGKVYADLQLASGTAGESIYTVGDFASNKPLDILKSDITAQGGGLKIYATGTAANAITAYAVYVYFPGSSGGYCVDSTGNTKTSFTGVATFTAASNFVTCSASTGL